MVSTQMCLFTESSDDCMLAYDVLTAREKYNTVKEKSKKELMDYSKNILWRTAKTYVVDYL